MTEYAKEKIHNESHKTLQLQSGFKRILGFLKPLQNKWGFPELNGMRVIAIFAVVLGHINTYVRTDIKAPVHGISDNFLHIVDISMDVLLVLSGFLIGIILFRSIDRKDKRYFIRFYLRRAMRLFPAYYAVLFFLSVYVRGGVDFSNKYFWQELLFFTNYPHPGVRMPYLMSWSWYLSIEEHFYAGIPIAVWTCARFFRWEGVWPYVLMAVGAYGVTMLILFIFMDRWDAGTYEMYIFQPTHSRLVFLLSGVVAAYLSHYEAKRVVAFFHRMPSAVFLGSVAPLILIGLWYILASTLGTENPVAYPIITLILWPLSAMTWAVYYLMAVHVDFKGKSFIGARIFQYLAPISYPVYLTHSAVIRLLVCPFATQTGLFIQHGYAYAWSVCIMLTLVVCLMVSYILHVLIEKPVVWLREHISVAKSRDYGVSQL